MQDAGAWSVLLCPALVLNVCCKFALGVCLCVMWMSFRDHLLSVFCTARVRASYIVLYAEKQEAEMVVVHFCPRSWSYHDPGCALQFCLCTAIVYMWFM